MRLNLGCGADYHEGYVNVDFSTRVKADRYVDLSSLPWPFDDSSADEILMLDFLEHFPYRKTDGILLEAWRVLKPGGKLIVQVPDVDHCSRALCFNPPFLCNRCGWQWSSVSESNCGQCRQHWSDCSQAAAHRLYGGQDVEGNWHYNAFSKLSLRRILEKNAFGNISEVEKTSNGETFYQNWNFMMIAEKLSNPW